MNIVSLFDQSVQKYGSKTAIIDIVRGRDRQWTYGQIDQCVREFAGRLHAAGLKQGSRVLVFYPISVEFYALLLALFRLEMTAVFIDPGTDRRRLKEACLNLSIDAVAGPPKSIVFAMWNPALRAIARKIVLPQYGQPFPARETNQDLSALPFDCSHKPVTGRYFDEQTGSQFAVPSESVAALLTLSSGSTAFPKTIVRSHDLLFKQYQAISRCLDLQANQTYLTALPIFVLANLAAGTTVILPPLGSAGLQSMNSRRIVEQIATYRPSHLLASPYFVEELARFCWQEKIELSSLRSIFTGGAPVFFHNLQRIKLLSKHADIHIVYGSSEAEPIAHMPVNSMSVSDLQRMRSGHGLPVGRPVKEIAVRIVRPQNTVTGQSKEGCRKEREDVEVGLCGRIAVSGEHVVQDVAGDSYPGEDRIVLDGKVWHLTGDSGFFDEKGQLWLLGRSTQICPHASNLNPFSIESLARECSGVKKAALIRLDEYSLPVLAIEPEVGSKPDVEQLFEMIGSENILVIGKIPLDKRHNGKVDYAALKRVIERRRQLPTWLGRLLGRAS